MKKTINMYRPKNNHRRSEWNRRKKTKEITDKDKKNIVKYHRYLRSLKKTLKRNVQGLQLRLQQKEVIQLLDESIFYWVENYWSIGNWLTFFMVPNMTRRSWRCIWGGLLPSWDQFCISPKVDHAWFLLNYNCYFFDATEKIFKWILLFSSEICFCKSPEIEIGG